MAAPKLSLAEIEALYGRETLLALLDLQQSIKQRGIYPVRFMRAGEEWAEKHGARVTARAIDDELSRRL
jgi:hypothetical protein